MVLLEKHAAYQRHHVLRLVRSSLAHAPPVLAAAVPTGVTKTVSYSDFVDAFLVLMCSVFQSLLETTLHEIAARGGVRIVRDTHVQQADTLAAARIVVGCDGELNRPSVCMFGAFRLS